MGAHHTNHVHSIHGVCEKMIFQLLVRGYIAPIDESMTSWTPTERGRLRMGEIFEPKVCCSGGSDQGGSYYVGKSEE